VSRRQKLQTKFLLPDVLLQAENEPNHVFSRCSAPYPAWSWEHVCQAGRVENCWTATDRRWIETRT